MERLSITSLFDCRFVHVKYHLNAFYPLLSTHRLNETLETWLRDPSNNVLFMLVNGLLEPVMEMETGVWKRFRFVLKRKAVKILKFFYLCKIRNNIFPFCSNCTQQNKYKKYDRYFFCYRLKFQCYS